MNILYHHRTQGKGVERTHIMGIVEAWRKAGHRVEIVSPPRISLEAKESSKRMAASSKTWILVSKYFPEVLFEILEILHNLWAFQDICRRLRMDRYDFFFERYAFLCFAGYFAALTKRVPYFLEINYTTQTPIVRKRNRFIRPIEKRIERFLLKRANGIIAVSTFLRDQLVKSGIDSKKILVLPNAADPEKFDPGLTANGIIRDLNLEGKKIVGFVGYFYRWHGVDLLIDSYTYVSKRDDRVIYLLLGDGPVFEETKKRVIQSGLEDKILLIGEVPHERVAEYVSTFSVAVMPHSNVYGSPMKVLEYMAMGKPTVAPRLSPLEDVIENGKNGLLFEPGDVRQLSEKISEVLSNENLKRLMGESARMSVVENRNWTMNAKKILCFIEKRNRL